VTIVDELAQRQLGRNFRRAFSLSAVTNQKRNPYLTDEERAEIRTQQKADAPRAMADYQAAEQETRERTEKLRKARQAREAADDSLS
jgi:hypothetical protein